LFLVEFAVPLVLDLAEVQAGHLATVGLGQVAGGTAVSGTDVQHLGFRSDFDLARHPLDGAPRRGGDVFVRGVVEADVNVVPAPDVEVEIVGVFGVVVVAGDVHRTGVSFGQLLVRNVLLLANVN